MSGLFGLGHGSWGDWRGWLFLAVMLALLVGMDLALLPQHADMFMISAAAWGWVVILGSLTLARGRNWRWIDLLKGHD
jgi:hypothetical protein